MLRRAVPDIEYPTGSDQSRCSIHILATIKRRQDIHQIIFLQNKLSPQLFEYVTVNLMQPQEETTFDKNKIGTHIS